jgi:phage shock protein C
MAASPFLPGQRSSSIPDHPLIRGVGVLHLVYEFAAEKKLKRSRKNKMIAGIIGGMAERYEMDATVLRIIYVLVSLFSAAFPGILVYLILWVIIPLTDE